MRLVPYPYQAMLAICSDLDETPDRQVYWQIARFLNTLDDSAMGPGIGLEVGNTIYFDMPPEQFAYWNTDDVGREMVRSLIRSGHIDCLHSFGDLATTRDHAARALDELARHDCRIECWVDHAVAPTNFGADIMHGTGDVPFSKAYHADLTCDFGITYVWRGRVTSVIGQDQPPCWQGIFSCRHPWASTQTVAKELAKHISAFNGGRKYAMHGSNEVLRTVSLRDGQRVYEFMRCNPYWGGVQVAATAAGVAQILTRRFIDRLVKREGVCILYTHLGKIMDRHKPFDERTVAALRVLADYHHTGRILVTTTRRLLGFRRAVREVVTTVKSDGVHTQIDLHTHSYGPKRTASLSSDDLAGLTFYVPDPSATCVMLNGATLTGIQQNGLDHTDQLSVSLPWPRLEFPDL